MGYVILLEYPDNSFVETFVDEEGKAQVFDDEEGATEFAHKTWDEEIKEGLLTNWQVVNEHGGEINGNSRQYNGV